MQNRLKSRRISIPPAKNGKPKTAKKSKPKQATLPSAPFSNYSNDMPLAIDQICKSLRKLTGGWPKCVSGALCYLHEGQLRTLDDAASLFAWIGGYAQCDWRRGAKAVTKEEFFRRLLQREAWEWATPFPHFRRIEGVLYLQKRPKAEQNGKLDELLDHFCPQTKLDRELLRALVLTFYWGGPPGKRPQFVILADEAADQEAGRGKGKTVTAQYLASLVGGCIDVDPQGGRDRITTTILSPSAMSQRVVLIDNLKTSKFSHDLLERFITRDEITGHRMYKGFAKRPNLLTWVITVNGAYFSTDMAQRSVVIRLKQPPMSIEDWDAKVARFIKRNRDAIAADVRWHLAMKKPAKLTAIDRWRSWCLNVLARCNTPNALLQTISERRQVIDADKSEVELAEQHLLKSIESHFHARNMRPPIDASVIRSTKAWLVRAMQEFSRDLGPLQAKRLLERIAVPPRWREWRSASSRGYEWTGSKVDNADPPKPLDVKYDANLPFERRQGR